MADRSEILSLLTKTVSLICVVAVFSACSQAPKDASAKSRNAPAPSDNRFVKTVLDTNINEPMELEVLADGRVLFIEREGAVKLFDPRSNSTKTVVNVPVNSTKEYGLIGMALDPNFAHNDWVYFFYSASSKEPAQHLSRFVFKDGKLELVSEKVLLKIPVNSKTPCCHGGGSLEFGPKGNLYISTGDNTVPFQSDGFSPVDESVGRRGWDAQRTSANTNDLRGKILRIKPEKDGSYSIPEGNLFAQGLANTRPEIYTMGNRNPFRISIDQHSGYLYWGEVGPDSGVDDKNIGPRGYDEINQARGAGFFGWPYFVADNKAYKKYDFVNKTFARHFHDANKPLNVSPNNSGMAQLPPSKPAFIWYPAAESEEFPELGRGGRTALAGPVYYAEDYQDSEFRFPEYFNGKLFIYDWIRNWIKVVTLDPQGDFVSIEPFLPNSKLVKPIDMQFAQDGTLYVLEYGSAWYSNNADAQLIRIKYVRGNRPPVAKIKASANNGAAPLAVTFSAAESYDLDGGTLSYEWSLNNKLIAKTRSLELNFDKAALNDVTLKVIDPEGETNISHVEIAVGNETPELDLHLKSRNGNRTFYWPELAVEYQAQVIDKEDGSLKSGGIKAADVLLSAEYLPDGKLMPAGEAKQQAAVSMRHLNGKSYIKESACSACHLLDKNSVGPSFLSVAKRYEDLGSHGREVLIEKIQKGGSGNWGEQGMPANPFSKTKIGEMLDYILSLAKPLDRLPMKGKFLPTHGGLEQQDGAYVFQLSYRDRGGQAPSLQAYKQFVLRTSLLAIDSDSIHDAKKGPEHVGWTSHGSYIFFKDIDFTGIGGLRFQYASKNRRGRIEVRSGGPDGALISTVKFHKTDAWRNFKELKAKVIDASGFHDICIVFLKEDPLSEGGLINLKSIQFLPDSEY